MSRIVPPGQDAATSAADLDLGRLRTALLIAFAFNAVLAGAIIALVAWS